MAAAAFEARMLASIAIEKRGTRFGASNPGIPNLLDNRGQTQWSRMVMNLGMISSRERRSLKVTTFERS